MMSFPYTTFNPYSRKQKKEKNVVTSNSKNKGRPLYLNWRLWVIVSLVLLIVAFVVLAVVGPDALTGVVTAGVAWVTGSGLWGLIVKFVWPPLWEEIKEAREDAKKANEKGDTNSESITFLRTQYESLGKQYFNVNKMYEMVVNDLQQERTESRVVTAELKSQINDLMKQNQFQQGEIDRQKRAHQEEITKLTEQIRLMGVEKSSDKETIVKLQTQITQLQDRVKELEDWGRTLEERNDKLDAENRRLQDESRDLKAMYGRRSTDKLGPLSAEAEARLNHLETEKERINNGNP